jgi:uncharacterized membrane protein YhaH (DUF805 family)
MADDNPYRPPRQIMPEPVRMPPVKVLFSFRGRIPRRTYWLYSVPVNVVVALLFEQLLALAGAHNVPPARSALPAAAEAAGSGPPWQAFALIAAYLPLLWMKLAVLAKRWHDQNRSANWLVVTFIPVVGMVINVLECGCNPGTRGENRYGPDPIPDPNARSPSPPVARRRDSLARGNRPSKLDS